MDSIFQLKWLTRFVFLIFLLNVEESIAQELGTPRLLECNPNRSMNSVNWHSIDFDRSGKRLVVSASTSQKVASTSSQEIERVIGMSRVYRWDLETFRLKATALSSNVFEQGLIAQFASDGKTIFGRPTINRWVKNGRPAGYGGPDRSGIASVLIWDGETTYAPLKPLKDPSGLFTSVNLSKGGKELFTINSNSELAKRELVSIPPAPMSFGPRTPRKVWQVSAETFGHPTKASLATVFSGDGNVLASIQPGTPPELLVWDLQKNMQLSKVRITVPGNSKRTGNPKRGKQKGRGRQGKKKKNKNPKQKPPANRFVQSKKIIETTTDGRFVLAGLTGPNGKTLLSVLDSQEGRFTTQFIVSGSPIEQAALSDDGNWITYVVSGKLHLRDVVGGRSWQPQGTDWSACEVAPASNFLAAANLHGELWLWRLPPHRAVSLAFQSRNPNPSAKDKILVASGPLPVWLDFKSGSQARYLYRLTHDDCLVAKQLTGGLQKITGTEAGLTAIRSNDQKHIWKWNEVAKRFEGDVILWPEASKAAPPKAATDDQELAYLLMGVRRLNGVLLESSQRNYSRSTVEAIVEKARRLRKRARSFGKRGESIAELYDEIATSAPKIAQSYADETQILDLLNEQMIAAGDKKSSAALKRVLNLVEGLGLIGMEELLTVRNFVGSEQVTNGYIDYYEEYSLLPGLGEVGINHIMSGYASRTAAEQRAVAADALANQAIRKKMTQLYRTRGASIEKILNRFESVAKDEFRFGIASRSSVSGALSSKQWEELLRVEAENIRLKIGRGDPMAQAELHMFQAAKKSVKAQELFSLASKIHRLADYIPNGECWNSDRANLLVHAASLITRGVKKESGGRKTADSYHRMAGYANEFLNQALSYQPQDQTGAIRRGLLYSLSQLGRKAEALQLCDELSKEFPNDRFLRVLIAGIRCSNGEIDFGLDDLEYAITELGYRDIQSIKRNKDFPANHIRFKALTTPELSADKIALTNGFSLSNDSLVPLYDLKIEVLSRTKSDSRKLRRLAPGQKFKWIVETLRPEKVRVTVPGSKIIELRPADPIFK